MAPRSKVELFAAIRRDSRAGLPVRELARKYRVHRRTVREALSSAWPAPRKKLPPRKSRLEPFKPAIDAMLRADLDAPRKQRHTVKRVYDRLVAEHGMSDLSYDTVWEYVQWRRPQMQAEAGRGPERVFIPQSHKPGVGQNPLESGATTHQKSHPLAISSALAGMSRLLLSWWIGSGS